MLQNKYSRITSLLAATLAVTLISGCSSGPAEEYADVTLNGQVKMAAGPMPEGNIYFRIYLLESLSGELAHPLEEIMDFTSDSPTFVQEFSYPLHMGTGLAVHAWLDTDGDGIYCTPTARLDPGGMYYQAETPEGAVDIVIELTDNCRAANWFYPPAP